MVTLRDAHREFIEHLRGKSRASATILAYGKDIEQLVVFLPSLWIFAIFVHELTAAGLGLVFFFGRILYCRSYVRDPDSRGPGFMLSALPSMIMLLGGLIGAVLDLY